MPSFIGSLLGMLHTLVGFDGTAFRNVTVDELGHLQVDALTVSELPTFYPAAPTLYNVTLNSANTEYSQALPSGCRRFEFHCRAVYAFRFAFVTGKVAGPTAPYMSLLQYDWFDSGLLQQGASPSTVYFGTYQAGIVIELLAWT